MKVFRAEDLPGARSRQGFNQVKRPLTPLPHLGALSIYLLKVPVVLFESDSDEHGLTPAIQFIQCFVSSRSVKSVEIYSACHISKNNLRTAY